MVNLMIPDDVYVHKTVEGDGSAFNELVQRHYAKIYGLACRMLGNPDDASDATQETFLEAYKSLQSFQFQSKFSTWLYRVAINTCQQHIRKSDSRGRTLMSYSNSLREQGNQYVADLPEADGIENRTRRLDTGSNRSIATEATSRGCPVLCTKSEISRDSTRSRLFGRHSGFTPKHGNKKPQINAQGTVEVTI